PRKPKISPARTLRSIPRTASTPPLKVLTRPRALIAPGGPSAASELPVGAPPVSVFGTVEVMRPSIVRTGARAPAKWDTDRGPFGPPSAGRAALFDAGTRSDAQPTDAAGGRSCGRRACRCPPRRRPGREAEARPPDPA